jgi:hypothetical protein
MARGKIQRQTQPAATHTQPALLPPRDQDDDPTPLLATLARVAVSIAARRRARRDTMTGPENPAEGGPEQAH